MKLNMSKEWFLSKVSLEDGVDVAAGRLAANAADTSMEQDSQLVDSSILAFGALVHLMRRKRALTAERLAECANVELLEIVNIEHDFHFRPEPRTVYQLAGVFELPVRSLMELSGNAELKDKGLHDQAVRFAACSDSLERLSAQEQAVLSEFVDYLSKD